VPLIGAIVFTVPWALAGLLALPVIWWLLRFTPPRPQTVKFPPLRLLLDLVTKQEQPDKTPWWLLLLRLALAAIVILAVAHPVYAPGRGPALDSRPVLIVVDDGWASARNWQERQNIVRETLDGAQRNGTTAALATTTASARLSPLEMTSPVEIQRYLLALQPRALTPDRLSLLARLRGTYASASSLRVVWISDGLDYGETQEFARGLADLAGRQATVEVHLPDPSRVPVAMAAPVIDGGRIKVTALRLPEAPADQRVQARAANGRVLAETDLAFEPGSGKSQGFLDLPLELRNEASRIEVEGNGSASGVYLFDDRWRRKTVALMSGVSIEAAQPLLSPLYYVSRAIEPYAEIYQPSSLGELKERLDAGLSVLVLADIGILPADQREAVTRWVEGGGLLLRFAGPRFAGGQDDLIPVPLREGGRALGSALSWETPQPLQPFPASGPFAGLAVDTSVRVNRQVLAEPDANLLDHVWASLEDGTPLVTGAQRGKGMVVLFHVTANADWSNLPLTGMFVEMLRRTLDLAPGAGGGVASGATAQQARAAWAPVRVLTGSGELVDPPPETPPIAARDMDTATVSAAHPAGLYERAGAQRALNVAMQGDRLLPIPELPAEVTIRSFAATPERPLAPWLFAAAMILFIADCIVALALSGAWQQLRQSRAALILLGLLVGMTPVDGQAQDTATDFALKSTLQTHLAFVLTNDPVVDDTSRKGLAGLTNVLIARTSVEPGDPVEIDIERDEIVFFPLLYWPVTPATQPPSPAALAKLDAYMKNGGTIFFDTREDGTGFDAMSGNASPALVALRSLLGNLDIPPLEPVPPEHVLTKSFYLMQTFPGRYDLGRLWVEASDSPGSGTGNADGVSSIIIGSNDYAAAWAQDSSGRPLFAAIPGGEQQREYAYRSGINIVMYALTGNYKADQVHVPSLLERLGQ
jgi:hypothetical protein